MVWQERRQARAQQRSVLREVSALKPVRACRRRLLPHAGAVRVRMAEGVAHYAGLMLCGSPWACPDCSAKIRQARAVEIEQVFGRHLAGGGGAYFITLTARHHAHDDARKLVRLVSDTFRALTSGRAAAVERKALGLLGHVRSFEVTHGGNGFHPHLHLLVATERPLTAAEQAELEGRWRPTWARLLVAGGGGEVTDRGFKMEPVKGGASGVAAYITKVVDGVEQRTRAGMELARGDLKKGRHKTRAMSDVLDSFIATGDLDELEIWNRYERATKGVSAVRWSRGLRDKLGAEPEADDAELAAAEVENSVDVLTIGETTWHKLMASRTRGADARVLTAAERAWAEGGAGAAAVAVRDYLRSIGIPDPWVREWEPPPESSE